MVGTGSTVARLDRRRVQRAADGFDMGHPSVRGPLWVIPLGSEIQIKPGWGQDDGEL